MSEVSAFRHILASAHGARPDQSSTVAITTRDRLPKNPSVVSLPTFNKALPFTAKVA